MKPSPENDQLYKPVDRQDPDFLALVASIDQNGILEPLVATSDGYLISGHRRHAAATVAGLDIVPVRIEQITRFGNHDEFVSLLREHNRQRVKTLDEMLREEVVAADQERAYTALLDHRYNTSRVPSVAGRMRIGDAKRRAVISPAKAPFLAAIQTVIEAQRKFWPLSDRRIHYALLNIQPLKHASKPDSTYINDLQSYKALVDLLTRARLTGQIPFEAIADDTRPIDTWGIWRNPQTYLRDEIRDFAAGYWRDLLQSQPNQIELIGEKSTLQGTLRGVAAQYCVPMTIGRGYCSLPPRHAMARRFEDSGKEQLVLLIVSDFDPDGEEIAASFARSMRDDFNIANVEAVKVALTARQVREFDLPPRMTAKETSSNHRKFVDQHGEDVFEVEALEPDQLQTIVGDAIRSVLDMDLFEQEVAAEKRDAVFLDETRQRVSAALRGLQLDSNA